MEGRSKRRKYALLEGEWGAPTPPPEEGEQLQEGAKVVEEPVSERSKGAGEIGAEEEWGEQINPPNSQIRELM